MKTQIKPKSNTNLQTISIKLRRAPRSVAHVTSQAETAKAQHEQRLSVFLIQHRSTGCDQLVWCCATIDSLLYLYHIARKMSLAKLTAVSTKTLSLLLERQRLQTLPIDGSNASTNGSSLHYPQIKRNLAQLREGILAMESKEGPSSEAAKLLRNQYDRMRGMLWEEERAEIPR